MVTFAEKARAWARRQGSANSLREAVRSRLLDPDPPQVGYGRIDEFPEDVVVELLTDRQLSTQDRKAVASGWDAALSEVQRLLRDPLLEPAERKGLQRPFTRVFRVAELTGHPFLREGVRSTLPLVTAKGARITPAQLQEVVAAAFAYTPDDADRADWERLLQTRAEVAGFAFRMLLRLDPLSRKISDYIQGLFRRQFQAGWNLDAWFLAEYVISATGNDEPIIEALLRVASHDPTLWNRIATGSQASSCYSAGIIAKVKHRLVARHAIPRVFLAGHYTESAERLLRNVVEHEASFELLSPTIRGRRRRVRSEDLEGETIELLYSPSDMPTRRIVSDAIDRLLRLLEKKAELRARAPGDVKGATHG